MSYITDMRWKLQISLLTPDDVWNISLAATQCDVSLLSPRLSWLCIFQQLSARTRKLIRKNQWDFLIKFEPHFCSDLVDVSCHDATDSDIEKSWHRYVICSRF